VTELLSIGCGFVTFVAIAGWSPLTATIAVLAVVAAGLRGRVHVPRPYLLPSALLLVGLVFLAPLSPPEGTGFIGLPSFKVAVFNSLLVVLALARVNSPSERLILLCMGVSLTMACGMTTQRLPYLYLVAAQLVLFTAALRARRPGPPFPWLQALFLLPVLLLSLGLILLLGWSEYQLNEWLQNFDYGINTVNFPNSTRLSSLRSSQNSPMLIARVFSERPPAYLVGRTYARYQKFTWDVEPGKRDVTGRLQGSEWAYELGRAAAPAQQDAMELSSSQSASLLLPRDAFELTLPCRQLTRFGGGSWQVLTGDTFTGHYRLQRVPGRFLQQDPLPDPAPFLQLPPHLTPSVAELASQVGGDREPLELAAALESWFHENFQYGYGYPFEEAEDPVESFLVKRPAAHCELFACSMALMLRARGIPSRYVVGFLVRERSPMGGYSVVRARDAHAWVEAWIEGRGWVQFDPTPPQATAPAGGLGSWMESLSERLLYHWSRFVRLLKTNPLQVLREALGLLRSPALLGLLVVLLLVVFRKRLTGWRWLSRSQPVAGLRPPPEVERLHGLLERFERTLAERGSRRPEAVTLLQWRARAGELSEREKEFLEDYCRVRYGRALPAPEDLERLEAYLRPTTG